MKKLVSHSVELAGVGRFRGVLAALVLMVSAWPAVTQAADERQPGASALQEIVVTARKREEALQDVPGSAAALDTTFLEDIGGIESLRDLTDQIPGLTITEGQFPEVTEPSIRGAGQARNRMSVSATGVYRNGAYIAGKGIYGRNFARMDSFDLAQVEVYRGPQGAMYGRNALGGAIHLISQKPTEEFEADFAVTAGENEKVGYQAIVNVPVTDTLATRFGYVHENVDGGFYKDIDGEPVDTSAYEQLRASVAYSPGAFSAVYMFDHMDSDGTPVIGINPREAVRAANDYDDFQTLINTEHRSWNRIDNHNLRLKYETGFGTFHYSGNYRVRDAGWERDPDHDDNAVARASREDVHKNHTEEDLLFQELRLDSETSGNTVWTVGADYYSADSTEDIDVYFPHLINNTLARFDDPLGTVYDSIINIDQDSWSVFGMVEYGFSGIPLTLSGEIRYARDDVRGTVAIYQPYQGCAKTLGQEPCTAVDGGDDYQNVPWTVTARWHLLNLPDAISSANLYAKIASSYRHGGLNLAAGLPSDAFPAKSAYGEETSDTLELGLKSTWFEDNMTLNVAVFTTDYENFLNTTTNGCPSQCPYLDPETFQPLGYNPDGSRIETNEEGEPGQESGIVYFIDNVGDVEMWGYEVELAAFIPVGRGTFNTTVGYSRQMGEVKSIRPDVSPANSEVVGANLNNLRPHNWAATARFKHPLGSSGVLAGVEFVSALSWVSEKGGFQTLPEPGSEARALDDFSRLDARLGFRGERWSLFVEGSNVTDEKYALNEDGAGVIRINDPAYYSATLNLQF